MLDEADIVHKVTIVPRGQAGGYAVMLPKEDRYFMTKPELLDKIAGLLGGRVAEEIVFGEVVQVHIMTSNVRLVLRVRWLRNTE